jgi:hypothetical protein
MRQRQTRQLVGRMFLAGVLLAGVAWVLAAAKDMPPEAGPDVVILRELENTYEAVPFEHREHAKMAQMWYGCVTCHHRSPEPTRPAAGAAPVPAKDRTQEAAARIPACKSCHPVFAADADIHMPSLKGAYHRQCLNCHQEWMHENACVVCHKPREDAEAGAADPAPDDIVGRMHPPIPEPRSKLYKTRFTPADGGNVLFRHEEHTVAFGIKCINCHHRDNCAHCHSPTGDTSAEKPLRPGMTWDESHGPCMGCHRENHCRHCHYKDGRAAPAAFDHAALGQGLDEDHAKLACEQCHPDLKLTAEPSCGEAACHKDRKIDYPTQRPGPVTPQRVEPSGAAGQQRETTEKAAGSEGR